MKMRLFILIILCAAFGSAAYAGELSYADMIKKEMMRSVPCAKRGLKQLEDEDDKSVENIDVESSAKVKDAKG